MANYSFLDAAGSILQAASSVIGGINYPIVKVPDGIGISGSVIANITTSIIGTYPDNSAWTQGSAGMYVVGVRNDTMSSVTAADLRYSPITVGPVGENITANAPINKWFQANTSIMYGTSVQAVAPQGASVFSYVTGIQIVNASANNAYVTFTGGLGSVLGFTVAPANGGSNIVFPNGLKTGANSGFSASISGVASVYLSAQGFISKT